MKNIPINLPECSSIVTDTVKKYLPKSLTASPSPIPILVGVPSIGYGVSFRRKGTVMEMLQKMMDRNAKHTVSNTSIMIDGSIINVSGVNPNLIGDAISLPHRTTLEKLEGPMIICYMAHTKIQRPSKLP